MRRFWWYALAVLVAAGLTQSIWASAPPVAQTGAKPAPAEVKAPKPLLDPGAPKPAQRATGGPDAFGYEYIDSNEAGGPVFGWVDISGTGTNLLLDDDDNSGLFNMGMTFTYYGTPYTQANVGSNGTVYFGTDTYLGYGNVCLPGDPAYGPLTLIAGFWTDLDPGSQGGVYYELQGVAPNRRFIVMWSNVPECCGAGDGLSFEVILSEADGSILLQYQDVNMGTDQGAWATTGIQNSATLGLQYSCETASLTDNLAVLFEVGDVLLWTNDNAIEDCPGTVVTYPMNLKNNTGATASFDITYTGFAWAISGPSTVSSLADGATANFNVTHTIPPGALNGDSDTGTVTATDQSDPAKTGARNLTTTAQTEYWSSVAASSPSWAGTGYPVDGCACKDGSGQWVTYIIGDNSGFAGFWGYNHATNAWFNPGSAGTPADRWAPDWAYDPATNLCYLTGGATAPGGGDLAEAYVFDPVANSFTALPSFTSVRDFHDSWVGTIDGAKYLCIGGGVNVGGTVISSTQCYNLGTLPGAWEAENAQMGTYPLGTFGSADGTLDAPTGSQFWVVSGVDSSFNLTDTGNYFDDADNAWHALPATGAPMYRMEGDFFNGSFYRLGGSTGLFTPVGTAIKYDGAAWLALPDLPNARMDGVVGVTDTSIWSIDGYGSASANYVDYLEICAPPCVVDCSAAAVASGGLSVNFTGTATLTGCVALPAFAWDFGDGATSALQNTSHTYAASGTYTWTLTVTADGVTCTTTGTITVTSFDITLFDDYGRARLCLNSATGAFKYTVLRGYGAGQTFTGVATLTKFNRVIYMRTPYGLPYTLNGTYMERYHKGQASFSQRPLRINSTLYDSNTLNNPPGC